MWLAVLFLSLVQERDCTSFTYTESHPPPGEVDLDLVPPSAPTVSNRGITSNVRQ